MWKCRRLVCDGYGTLKKESRRVNEMRIYCRSRAIKNVDSIIEKQRQHLVKDEWEDGSKVKVSNRQVNECHDDHPIEKISKNFSSQLNDERLKRVHGGFGLSNEKPDDKALDRSKSMENLGYTNVEKMVDSTNIHDAKVCATLAKDQFIQSLQASGNHSKNTNLLFNLGLCYYTLELWDVAMECFMASIEFDQCHIPSYKYIGDCFQMQGLHAQAIWCYDEYMRLFPDFYGRIRSGMDEKDELECEDLNQVSKSQSEVILSDLIFKRAKSYFNMKEIGSHYASEDFKWVVRMGSKWVDESLHWLGRIEARKANHWKAIEWYSKALENNKNNLYAYYDRSQSWEYLGKEDLAREDLNRALHLKRKSIWEGKMDSQTRRKMPEFDMGPLLDTNPIFKSGKNKN